MFLVREFTVAATGFLLIAAGFFASASGAMAESSSSKCEDLIKLSVLTSPITPWKGAPLRAVFAVEDSFDGKLSLVSPNGKVAATSSVRHGGPPYFWFAEVAKPASGKWRAKLTRDGASGECSTITRDIAVRSKRPRAPSTTKKSVWPLRAAWNRKTENLYSAWIEKLFLAPVGETPSWKALHGVLRDKTRNVLFNHLGLREDEKRLTIRPDCADLPYFLRAYFAFKMGLPFGYSKCTRGGGGKAPRCFQWWNIVKEEPPPPDPSAEKPAPDLFGLFAQPAAPPKKSAKVRTRPSGLVPGFGFYLRTTVANGVHSGGGRARATDSNNDYYHVPLNAQSVRPGTVYADPYGHLLVIARRVPQPAGEAGILLAVDAQPDGTVAIKRFWRGNFLFANDPALGGPGFKRFRPVVAKKNGDLRRLTNGEIQKHPHYGDFSLEQSKLSNDAFYDRMDDLISPEPLNPLPAMIAAVSALEEQVIARVTSVENGRKFQNGGGGEVPIPDGPSIFETTGPWEDFATPARDLRILIAIDVVRKFPDRVARRPQRYAMPEGKSVEDVKAELERELSAQLAARKFTYKRSDGSDWELTLKDVLDRIVVLEMAYNINDCVEHRWGAPENSEEASTCKRRAPQAQVKKMSGYRAWFQERQRPPRG